MHANSFGDTFQIHTFGESHGAALGVVIDGVAPNVPIDVASIQAELERRRPGQSSLVSPRKEGDQLEILSGIFEGKTTGTPICMIVRNTDAKPSHYETIKDLFRPGHADFTWLKKFGLRDWRGGGRSSARETVARVAAGAIAKQLLSAHGVRIVGHVSQVAEVKAAVAPEDLDVATIESNPVRCGDPAAAERMAAVIEDARKAGDSVGGVVEVVALGVPAGWGDPVFMKLNSQLAAALMSINAVKAVEIGDGFELVGRRGSQANDPITPAGFATNRAGGILGGISSGAPIVARMALKPTASIRQAQATVDIHGHAAEIRVPGRHDPCVCPRAVPIAEAMVALVLADACLRQQAIMRAAETAEARRMELAHTDAEILRLLHRRREVAKLAAPAGGPEDETALAALRREMAPTLDLSPSMVERVFDAIRDLSA